MIRIAHLFIDNIEWKTINVMEFDTRIRIPFCPPLSINILKTPKIEVLLRFFIFELSSEIISDKGEYFHKRYDLIDVK